MILEKGIFTISIDYEYAWGYADQALSPSDLIRIRGEVEITKRLITLFEKYKIPATWAVVGRLLEEGKEGRDTAWFDAESLIQAIRRSPAGHEIGSHSFGHIIYGESLTDAVERDVASARQAHDRNFLSFSSFVFPRNSEGHHALLAQYGLAVYRGLSKKWYSALPHALWPLFEGVDYLLSTARTVLPTRHESGLINIPDSLNFVSRKSIKKLLPPTLAAQKIIRGIEAAISRKEIFHLWFHPSNFSYDTDLQFKTLENVLWKAKDLRETGMLDVLVMSKCAEHV